MQYKIDGNKLIITVDQEERDQLRLEKIENEDFESDDFMFEFLEPLICNSELNWVDPSITGDLTDAPILAIFNPDDPDDPFADQVILDRWAFMDYMVKSVTQELLDHGQVIFVQ